MQHVEAGALERTAHQIGANFNPVPIVADYGA